MVLPNGPKESYYYKYGKLKDIPDEDLFKILQENYNKDAAFLAFISSEVLRRIIEQEYKSVQADDDD